MISKKSLFLIVYILFSSTAMCQIQRSFFGLTLNVSTISQVENYLRSNNRHYEWTDTNQIMAQNMQFGGYIWSWVSFYFSNGKLAQVGFVTLDRSYYPIDNMWKSLSRRYKEKYPSYLVYDDAESINFKDSFTSLYITHSYLNNRYSITVLYATKSYEDEQFKRRNDEL